MTGTMYFVAILVASIAMVKQSVGDWGATIATGHSPLRPNMACSKSACSVLVGKPVEGPPRWTLMMINGSSVMAARPMASALRATPGPLVPVRPIAPPKAAPMEDPTAEISSSAWKVLTPKCLKFDNPSRIELAGVIG